MKQLPAAIRLAKIARPEGRGLGAVAAIVFFLASCTGPSVKVLDRPVGASPWERVLGNSSQLTKGTKAVLRAEGLSERYRRSRDEAIATMAERQTRDATAGQRLALAELCFQRAEDLVSSQPAAAAGRYLDVLQLTERAALAEAAEVTDGLNDTLYQKAAARLTRVLHASGGKEMKAPGVLQTYDLNVASGREFVSPADFDLVVPADWLDFNGLDLAPVQTHGFGAAMVGHRARAGRWAEEEPRMPPSGHSLPLNASVRFSGSRATLNLQDLMVKGRTERAGQRITLEGDFTAALAFYYHDQKREAQKIMATLRPGKFRDRTGLFTIEPFREDKIPLVIVHGLLSTAEDWMPFVNQLRADPVVRERYQMIFFNYPSGNPIPWSATKLRHALTQYRDRRDPKRDHPPMRKMVILGHSMGGVLSNIQIRSSGKRLEKVFLEQPLDELDLPPAEKDELRDRLYFEANPDITRAILMASPHRGSKLAANPIGQIGSWLIRLPFDVVDSVLGELLVVDAITDVAQNLLKRPSNSVTSLRPDNPVLSTTLELPVRSETQIHSIIARTNPSEPLLESSDGVVPYPSAHLPGVKSELIVEDANHSSMVTRPETIREVWRLLRIHAGVTGR